MNTEEIRKLNEDFRKYGIGCRRIMMTHGVAELSAHFKQVMVNQMRTFNSFTNDNDPHGEHDFGAFDLQGQKVFFKINYYDRSLKAGS